MVGCKDRGSRSPAGERDKLWGAGGTGFPPPSPALPSHGPLPTLPSGDESGPGPAWAWHTGFSSYLFGDQGGGRMLGREGGPRWIRKLISPGPQEQS